MPFIQITPLRSINLDIVTNVEARVSQEGTLQIEILTKNDERIIVEPTYHNAVRAATDFHPYLPTPAKH